MVWANEREALPYVDAGILRVDLDGKVWRCKRKLAGRGGSKWVDRTPTRADVSYSTTRTISVVRLPLGYGLRLEVSAARLVWSVIRGPIPDDQRLWRFDGDHSNNDPANLYLADRNLYSPGVGVIAKQSRSPFDDDYVSRLRHACDHPSEFRLLEAIVKHGSQAAAARAFGCTTGPFGSLMKTLMARLAEASEEGAATWQPY